MAKILLVEDDNNLREIYEARLLAEGYEIVSAPDGEAALVVAKKELPDLVISDVMMPRVSGFEMLDIMRNTDGLKHIKVIMLTALGQAEDKTRADSLGADRYVVKSQVTLEDIVKIAAELLGGGEIPAPATPSTAAAAAEFAQTQTMATPVTPAPAAPTVTPVAVAEPPAVTPAPIPVNPTAPTPVATPSVPVAVPPAPAAPISEPVNPPAPAAPASTPPLATATANSTPPNPTAAPAPNPPAATTPTTMDPSSPAPASVPQQAAPAPADSQLVATAVQDLINGTAPPVPAQTSPNTQTPAVPPPPTPPAPVVPATPQAQAPPAAAIPAVDETGSKKIIQPLTPDNGALPTDLNELMAKEGHALDAVAPQENPLPHQPGLVISPNPVNAAGQPEDPNKISL